MVYYKKYLLLTRYGLGCIIIFIRNIFLVTVAGSIYSKSEFLISQIINSFFGNNLFLVVSFHHLNQIILPLFILILFMLKFGRREIEPNMGLNPFSKNCSKLFLVCIKLIFLCTFILPLFNLIHCRL